MARLHYSGPVDRVQIPLPDGRTAEVSKGHDIDLRDEEYGLTAAEAQEFEKGLLKQDTWSEVDEKPTPRSSTEKKEN